MHKVNAFSIHFYYSNLILTQISKNFIVFLLVHCVMLDNHMKRKHLMKMMEIFLTRGFLEPDIPAYPIKVPLKDPNNISKKIPRRFQKSLPRRFHRRASRKFIRKSPKMSPKRSPRRFPNRKISAVHLKPKPECEVCGECFAHQHVLDQHKASQHAEDLKLVECSVCSETFKNHRQLQTHVLKFH